MSESILKFIDYKIDSVDFKLNKNFESENEEIAIAIHVERKVDIRKENFQLSLRAVIGSEEKTQPFKLDVVLVSIFETEGEVELLVDNATAIMYPYLRSFITNVTAMFNIPSMTLPVVNITKMFNDKESKT